MSRWELGFSQSNEDGISVLSRVFVFTHVNTLSRSPTHQQDLGVTMNVDASGQSAMRSRLILIFKERGHPARNVGARVEGKFCRVNARRLYMSAECCNQNEPAVHMIVERSSGGHRNQNIFQTLLRPLSK